MAEELVSGDGGGIADGAQSAAGANMNGIADTPPTDDGGQDSGGIADDPGAPSAQGNEADKDAGKASAEPEAYELAAPEDFPLPAENLTSFTAKARELGLSKEQAEGMLHWHKDFHAAVTGAMRQQENATLQGWEKEIQADQEFGGSHWKDTLSNARRALDVFDPDGSLRAMLRETRYQHNPAIIRAIARVGKAMNEHDFVGQGGKGGRIPLEERMYPNM
ncbi:hypothetical protein [Desulfovibrio sp. SGI.169]|uniref:hypothetical protein n=1 Tax=Desulfovibrio sp. SGI.169 TaxID=3420561 RepID=UPI003D07CE33